MEMRKFNRVQNKQGFLKNSLKGLGRDEKALVCCKQRSASVWFRL